MSDTSENNLVNCLNKLTVEIEKLTASHNELRDNMQAFHSDTSLALNECEVIESDLKSMKSEISLMSSKMRENNIIVYNIPEGASQEKDMFIQIRKVFEKLELEIPDYAINDVHRLGKKLEDITRPIVIKFSGSRWVKLIFSKPKNFKSKSCNFERSFEGRKNSLEDTARKNSEIEKAKS